jgi:hypothetical protein
VEIGVPLILSPCSNTLFCNLFSGDDAGKVVIWNMAPVRSEADENNKEIPKLLCQMDNHLGCYICLISLNSIANTQGRWNDVKARGADFRERALLN